MFKKITISIVMALLYLLVPKLERLICKADSQQPNKISPMAQLLYSKLRLEKLKLRVVLVSLCVYFLLCLSSNVKAQSRIDSIKPLKVGDKVPESFWQQEHSIYQNGNITKQNLSIYKSKVIILDFWGIYCTPCIEAFPKLAVLQNEFSEHLQIIGVGQEARDQLSVFFKKHGELGFPTAIEDQFLNSIFKHAFIPHEVWINKDGVVTAFTSADKITTASIKSFITSGGIQVGMKIDQDLKRPLFASALLPENQLMSYSVLFKGHLEGTGASLAEVNLNDHYGLTITNSPLIFILRRIGKKLIPHFNPKLMRISIRDSTNLFVGDRRGEQRKKWYVANEYSLSMVLPTVDTAKLYQSMLQLISNQTEYQVKVERFITECLVLRLKAGVFPVSTHGVMQNTLEQESGKMLRNAGLNYFVDWLNARQNGLPVLIDDTNFKQPLNLDIGSGYDTEIELKKMLDKQGFELVREKQKLEMMVVTKKLE